MKEKLMVLIDLQALETDASRVRSALDQIPGMLEALDAGFLELKTRLTDATASINEIKKDYRSKEIEVETNLSRIKKSRDRMDSVKTNKEYHSLLKEIEDTEAKNSLIEDDMLVGLDRLEEGERDIRRLKQEMTLLEKKVAEQKAAIYQKAEVLNSRRVELENRLEAQFKQVDVGLLNTYQKVKLRVGPIAISPVNHAVCAGCHLTIPPQMYNDLHRQDSLKFCPHCHRIIYWLPEETMPVGVDKTIAGPTNGLEESPNTIGQGAP